MPKRKASSSEREIKRRRGSREHSQYATTSSGSEDQRRCSPSTSSSVNDSKTHELMRLAEDGAAWRLWGPYLSERQWGTVREDKSVDGKCWDDFTHDEAAYRAYSSGEDGLMGICDDQAKVCLALALWNGVDARLKERLFGLSGPQGNHGEDVKEVYFYLDSTPTHSYLRGLYKYPQLPFPYEELISGNAVRSRKDQEYEILDTGVFDQSCYWDVVVEYAKYNPHDILCQYTIHNRGPDVARLNVLPTLWFRNTWSEKKLDAASVKPLLKLSEDSRQVLCTGIDSLGNYVFATDAHKPEILFTCNETNVKKMNNISNVSQDLTTTENQFKDSFHHYIISGDLSAKHLQQGTKCAFHYSLEVSPNSMAQVRCRLHRMDCRPAQLFGKAFDDIMNQRCQEADQFYNSIIPNHLTSDEKLVIRQAYAGLCWSKQFYCFDGRTILEDSKTKRRNSEWKHMISNDVISMPDKWEFPWFASWDLGFQMIPFSDIDLDFAKSQLLLLLSNRYQHPNGQLPACEFDFSDANPPVHAWACLHLSRQFANGSEEVKDLGFLKKCFHKLVLNFNWWLNRKDVCGRYLFGGGFLGMDNVSAVDRSSPPEGTVMEQADGTAWMAFYARCMLEMALELSKTDPVYEDLAVTYLHHFVSIAEAFSSADYGLWDSVDRFFYDHLIVKEDKSTHVLRIRSLVGLVSLFPTLLLKPVSYQHLKTFKDELDKAINRLKAIPTFEEHDGANIAITDENYLISLVSHSQFKCLVKYLFDEAEFLAPFGIRSLSKIYSKAEFSVQLLDEKYSISYCPNDSDNAVFGGNSNWRGPVWLCMNYLLLEALDVYGDQYGNAFRVEFPTDSANHLTLHEVTNEIRRRISAIFLPDDAGQRPLNGKHEIFRSDPNWQGMVHFYEFYNPDTGQGLGASHQTGWSALVASILQHKTSA